MESRLLDGILPQFGNGDRHYNLFSFEIDSFTQSVFNWFYVDESFPSLESMKKNRTGSLKKMP